VAIGHSFVRDPVRWTVSICVSMALAVLGSGVGLHFHAMNQVHAQRDRLAAVAERLAALESGMQELTRHLEKYIDRTGATVDRLAALEAELERNQCVILEKLEHLAQRQKEMSGKSGKDEG